MDIWSTIGKKKTVTKKKVDFYTFHAHFFLDDRIGVSRLKNWIAYNMSTTQRNEFENVIYYLKIVVFVLDENKRLPLQMS